MGCGVDDEGNDVYKTGQPEGKCRSCGGGLHVCCGVTAPNGQAGQDMLCPRCQQSGRYGHPIPCPTDKICTQCWGAYPSDIECAVCDMALHRTCSKSVQQQTGQPLCDECAKQAKRKRKRGEEKEKRKREEEKQAQDDEPPPPSSGPVGATDATGDLPTGGPNTPRRSPRQSRPATPAATGGSGAKGGHTPEHRRGQSAQTTPEPRPRQSPRTRERGTTTGDTRQPSVVVGQALSAECQAAQKLVRPPPHPAPPP